MNLIFLAALFFVVIFAIVLQLITKCPYVPAAIVALLSLVVYAFLSATLGTIFIVWIIIYTLAALLASWITRLLYRNNSFGRCNQNTLCGQYKDNTKCNNCGCDDF